MLQYKLDAIIFSKNQSTRNKDDKLSYQESL